MMRRRQGQRRCLTEAEIVAQLPAIARLQALVRPGNGAGDAGSDTGNKPREGCRRC